MTFSNIFAFISLGRKLVETIADLRRDVQSTRSADARKDIHAEQVGALESRLADLESQTKEQHYRLIELEQSFNASLRATEALAERVSTTFWIATVTCGLALVGLVVSVLALTHSLR